MPFRIIPEKITTGNKLHVALLSTNVVIWELKYVLYFNCIPLHVVKISQKNTLDFYIAFKCLTTYNFENSYMSSK